MLDGYSQLLLNRADLETFVRVFFFVSLFLFLFSFFFLLDQGR